MSDAVEQRHGHLGIPEDLHPLPEAEVDRNVPFRY